MKVVGYLYGGAAVLKKYQVAETVADVGVPLLISTAGEAGLDLSTTTGAADMVGLNHDTATFVTAQQTDGTTAERTVTVDIRPDAIIKARLNEGATEGTALTLFDVTTATADGLDVTTGDDWSSPNTFDEGVVWAFDGANKGQIRKITVVGATSATVTVAFENDHAVGDNFLRAPFWPHDDGSGTVTLTTALTEVRADSAVTTSGAELWPIEIIAGTISTDGRNKSYVLLVPNDHALNKLA